MNPSVRHLGLGLLLLVTQGCASPISDTGNTTDETTDVDTTEDPTTDAETTDTTSDSSDSETETTSDTTGSETDSDSTTADSETTDTSSSESESDTTDSESDTDDSETDSDTDEVACGNGVLDEGEDCDGSEMSVTSCLAVDPDFKGGDLACNEDCTFDTDSCIQCLAPDHLPCDSISNNEFHALELNCETAGNNWDKTNATDINAEAFYSPDASAYRVARQFGTHMIDENTPAFGPQAGEKFLLLSTGVFPNDDPNGYVELPPGYAQSGDSNNDNPSGNSSWPGLIKPVNGGNPMPFQNCDVDNDCSNTLADLWEDNWVTNDEIYLQFETVVPEGTEGFSIDFAFFSSELNFIGHPEFNDIALVWLNSDSYTGNITFLYDGTTPIPMNVTTLDQLDLLKYGSSAPELEKTGFEMYGASTGWLTAHGPAEGGEVVTISAAIFDLDDSLYTSAIALDNFKWACEGCELGVPNSCGINH